MKNKNIQTEIDACFLYQKLALHETDATIANVFRQMSEIEKGSAVEAAVYSFILFAIGAAIPVLPFIFTDGIKAIIISVSASAIGLFVIGAAITLFTGKNVWYSGFRQVSFGLAAAAITFGIGKLIGVSVAG